jgi:hypothetical protein
MTPKDPARPRALRDFTGSGYDKGRGGLGQAMWFATMNLVFMKWWFPARLRPALLRAFGATVRERVLIRHRVRVLRPWKLTIGDDCWNDEDAPAWFSCATANPFYSPKWIFVHLCTRQEPSKLMEP